MTELETPLRAVEERLTELGAALQRQDSHAVVSVAAELHAALAVAMNDFSRAAQRGAVPAPLRQRLALAGGRVAAQREALARATASLDRAIDVLLPQQPQSALPLYASHGGTERSRLGGGVVA